MQHGFPPFITLLPILVIGSFFGHLHAQTPVLDTAQPDTVHASKTPGDTTQGETRDTTGFAEVLSDSTQVVDTTRMSTPSLVGTFDRLLDSARLVSHDDLTFLDYRNLAGILESMPGVFVRDHFSIGSYDQLSIRGVDWRSIAVTANGRLMNDPASGIYNLSQFTTEYADRIEFISGPRSFLYGVNSTGGAVNLVTKNYTSNRPLSKINYTESAYGYQYSDGTFSQNISRKVNFTFGYQHQGNLGRFTNAAHDAWNMRLKVRYNLSRDLNIVFSEYLTRTETQLNGGIDLEKTGFPSLAFNRIRAVPVNNDSFEKISRHDVDLSLVGTFLGDTTNVSMLTFYYSNNFREYRDKGAGTSNNVQIDSDHRSSWMGVLFTQDFHTEWQRFNLGANIELRQIEGSPNLGRRRNSLGNIWIKEELLLTHLLTVAGFARYDSYIAKETHLSAGADATLNPLPWLSLYGGVSTSKRFPTYQELFWSDSTVSRAEPISSERHHTVEIGIRIRVDDFDLRASYFHRTINNPILLQPAGSGHVFPGIHFVNGDRRITNGVEGKLTWRFWLLYIDGTATFLTQQDGGGNTLAIYPKLSASGGIYLWQKLLNDNLNLKIGFKGRYISGSQGERFNPEVLAYIPNTGTRLGFGSSVDGFLIAGLGNAYVTLMWENLTNSRYYVTPYYPVLDRAVRFGISWQFLD
ncbi:TonB-dependent receptor [Sphingobacteriales bacterium CHB3]|nr:TonB-dependent receptor [Sphingobacteriales bacterium CHB3]